MRDGFLKLGKTLKETLLTQGKFCFFCLTCAYVCDKMQTGAHSSQTASLYKSQLQKMGEMSDYFL